MFSYSNPNPHFFHLTNVPALKRALGFSLFLPLINHLPLSDNLDLNKSLGTRHRAGVGISEVSDSLTIIVSEETGKVSYAMGGSIFTGVTPGVLREQLNKLKMKSNVKEEAGKFRIWNVP